MGISQLLCDAIWGSYRGAVCEPSFPFVVGCFCPKESSPLLVGTTASPLLLPQTPNALE